MKTKEITLRVNGEEYRRTVGVYVTLAEFIREDLGLTGTKIGCNEGECGACTVILNGKPVNSCLVPVYEADGGEVLTVEGLKGHEGELHPIQQAFMDAGAVQCGYCIPGMVMTAKAILDENPSPTRDEIRKGIEGNICRCTGYNRIIDAIERASKSLSE